MKKNIVFWINSAGLFFGVAYFLQKNTNLNLYAICDVEDKQKSFFTQQKLVDFKQTYFFHDCVKKDKTRINYEYLRSFEQKYGIDLWKLAINDRWFYLYNDFYKFTAEEISSILEQECRFYEEFLENVKPDYLICMDPSTHHHRILYEMCRNKGIKVLLLTWAKGMGNKMMIAQDATKLDNFDFNKIKSSGKSHKELIDFINSLNLQKVKEKIQKQQFSSKSLLLKATVKFLFSQNNNIETHYSYYGRTKLKVLIKKIIIEIKAKYRQSFIDKNLSRDPVLDVPFVYFPLHMDQEQNPLITAPFFTNQLEAIRHVVKSLPPGYALYIKEHPHQLLRGWRKISSYKEILEIPNVIFIHPEYSSDDLVKNSALIITISGSTGLEGAFYDKPSIVFSDVRYSVLPSVYRLNNLDELPTVIKNNLHKKTSPEYLEKYVTFMSDNSFDVDLIDLLINEANSLYYGGFLVDTEISSEKVQEFFDENKEVLEKIAQEYSNKIDNVNSTSH